MEKTMTKSPSIQNDLREVAHNSNRFVRWLIAEMRWLFRVMISSLDRFYWDNGFSKAAALAYSSLLSLVPVTALAFSILGSFAITSSDGNEVVRFFFKQFFPSLETSNTVLTHLTEFSLAIANLNALMIGFVVITCLLLLNSVEYSLNEVWQVFEQRTISHRIAIFCAILVIGPILAISAYYTNFSVSPLLSASRFSTFLTALYDYVWPFLIDYTAFLLLYYLVPKAPVRFRSAAFGAFAAALMFDIAKRLFAIYVVGFSSYEKIYGTLAAIPIFLFWLYLAWIIVLVGAEICYQAQYLPKTGKVWKRSVLSVGDGKLVLAVQALVIVVRAFNKGASLPSELDIAEEIGCSSVLLKPALDDLKRSGIIARGDSRDMPIILTREPHLITLAQIKEALFQNRKAVYFPKELGNLFGAFCNDSQAENCSLADIIKN
jgi:membrane protein